MIKNQEGRMTTMWLIEILFMRDFIKANSTKISNCLWMPFMYAFCKILCTHCTLELSGLFSTLCAWVIDPVPLKTLGWDTPATTEAYDRFTQKYPYTTQCHKLSQTSELHLIRSLGKLFNQLYVGTGCSLKNKSLFSKLFIPRLQGEVMIMDNRTDTLNYVEEFATFYLLNLWWTKLRNKRWIR